MDATVWMEVPDPSPDPHQSGCTRPQTLLESVKALWLLGDWPIAYGNWTKAIHYWVLIPAVRITTTENRRPRMTSPGTTITAFTIVL